MLELAAHGIIIEKVKELSNSPILLIQGWWITFTLHSTKRRGLWWIHLHSFLPPPAVTDIFFQTIILIWDLTLLFLCCNTLFNASIIFFIIVFGLLNIMSFLMLLAIERLSYSIFEFTYFILCHVIVTVHVRVLFPCWMFYFLSFFIVNC